MKSKIGNVLIARLTVLLAIIGALTAVFVIAMSNAVGSIQDTQSKVNATEAIWQGEYFEYIAKDCGQTYLEKIKHFEDECIYDVFIPLYGLTKEK